MDFKVTLLFGGLLLLGTVDAQDQCLTPDQNVGKCVIVSSCPSIVSRLNALKGRPLQESDKAYLAQRQCGRINGKPAVCCVDQSVVEAESPTNTNSQVTVDSNILPSDCGRDLGNRIYGGKAMEIDEHPWMALLEYRTPWRGKEPRCGGSLISRRYVLTAAHCLVGLPSGFQMTSVRLGEYDTTTDEDCVEDGADGSLKCAPPVLSVGVEEQIVHEQYRSSRNSQWHDIALLRLARDVPFTEYVYPICLPSPEVTLKDKVLVAGWGKTETGEPSPLKLKLLVPVVKLSECAPIYRSQAQLIDSQLCAGGDQDRDSCSGDSGGPLMQSDHVNGSAAWSVIGIVSFGPLKCGQQGWPGVYTKVQKYLPWIHSKLRA